MWYSESIIVTLGVALIQPPRRTCVKHGCPGFATLAPPYSMPVRSITATWMSIRLQIANRCALSLKAKVSGRGVRVEGIQDAHAALLQRRTRPTPCRMRCWQLAPCVFRGGGRGMAAAVLSDSRKPIRTAAAGAPSVAGSFLVAFSDGGLNVRDHGARIHSAQAPSFDPQRTAEARIAGSMGLLSEKALETLHRRAGSRSSFS